MAILTPVLVLSLAGLLAFALASPVTEVGAPTARALSDAHADVCLEVATDGLPEGVWDQVVARVTEVVAERSALFPAPSVEAAPGLGDGPAARPSARLDIHSGHAGGTLPGTSAPCLAPDFEWSARLGRVFLAASADRMLEEAPTTPGIASDVTLEWYPDGDRVRTLLTFAGPLDIPNGRCWVDDVLSVDTPAGIAVTSGEQGLETSPFAEGACGRFFSHLPDGGAGQQAVTLLPAEISLEDGTRLQFVATEVAVGEDAVVISGLLVSHSR